MGNKANKLKVKYKPMKGSHEAGEFIEDPYDWFEALLVSERDDTMVLYNGLSAEQK